MSLSTEWQHRIERWKKELPNHFFRRLEKVEFEGFRTTDRLSLAEALRRPFAPVPAGAAWGAKWEYGWFRCRVRAPREAAGQRLLLQGGWDANGLVFVNGRASEQVGWANERAELTRRARAGETFDVVAEVYAGHGSTPCEAGPTPPGKETVPEPPAAQRVFKESWLGTFDEDAFQLFVDVDTLWHLRAKLDVQSLRVAEIDQGLRDFSTIVDFELPPRDRTATFRAARRRLAPLLACTNGSTAPQMFAVGHGHLDVAWLWPLAEADRKAARTFATQVQLMGEYPEYKFLQSQPHLYARVRETDPELYARVKKAVRAGQFIPEGGMWVESDTNIAGGEALIRQFVHGKRFFREEFGVDSEFLWIPDVFGYTGALPQIMKGCGIRYFSTAKIYWNYNGGDPFPYNTFWWEGIDGTAILTHLIDGYGGRGSADEAIKRWDTRRQKDGIATSLFVFGWGDGGGGPTREHIENVRRLKDLEGAPRCRMAGPLEFFRDLEKRGAPDARYVGELYYQCHRGTYTSQARTKRGNRKSELALREAEMWGAAAAALRGFRYPLADMDREWKKVLLNQFHDILPGSSIRRVYEEAEAAYAEVQARAGDVAGAARQALTGPADAGAITVFNSLNWPRKALAECPPGFQPADRPIQRVGDTVLVEADVPACGWTALRSGRPAAPRRSRGVKATAARIENDVLSLRLDRKGRLASVFDKEAGMEIAAGPCNDLRMFRDVPTRFDAWDIDSMYERTPVRLAQPAKIEVIAAGPLLGGVRVTRRLNESLLVQDIVLRSGSRRVDFTTTVEWNESHKMLKAAFPVNVFAHEAIHEIQFGHIRRPNHRSRPFDQDRFEVAQHKWTALAEENRGAAVLNDCKYGVNVLANCINLTLLRSPLAPDMQADKGTQRFTYALYAWNGPLVTSDLVRQGYDLNVPVTVSPGDGGEGSLLTVDGPTIVVESVKPAEDGSGDVVVRLYESMRTAAKCRLQTALPFKRVVETNMIEDPVRELAANGSAVALAFRPFEIKTVRFTARGG